MEKEVVYENEKMYYVEYISGSEILISYQQMIITERYSALDDKKCVVESVDINGNNGQVFSYGDNETTVIWHDKEYRYILITYSSEINKEMLIGIASSVK